MKELLEGEFTPEQFTAAEDQFLGELRKVRNEQLGGLIKLRRAEGFVFGWPEVHYYINPDGDHAVRLEDACIFPKTTTDFHSQNQDGVAAEWVPLDEAIAAAIKQVNQGYDQAVETVASIRRKTGRL
jgi:hypothetical protein